MLNLFPAYCREHTHLMGHNVWAHWKTALKDNSPLPSILLEGDKREIGTPSIRCTRKPKPWPYLTHSLSRDQDIPPNLTLFPFSEDKCYNTSTIKGGNREFKRKWPYYIRKSVRTPLIYPQVFEIYKTDQYRPKNWVRMTGSMRNRHEYHQTKGNRNIHLVI